MSFCFNNFHISKPYSKSKKNFSKNIFSKLEKNDIEKVIFIDFLQQEKILLLEYGFGNMEIIETKGHSNDSVSVAVFDEKNNEKIFVLWRSGSEFVF